LLKSAFSIDFENLLSAVQGRQPEYRKRFLIQVADKFRKVETEEVAYFYALEKNVFMKTFEGISYPVDVSLDRLVDIIDPGQFFRINRKYVVNMKSISNMFSWSRSRVKLILKPVPDDDSDTVVSIDRAGEFKMWMNR
jgi:two-component system, LytTR family, response regulator LytT